MLKTRHIQWDIDNPKDLKSLPTGIKIPEDTTTEDEISNYLSDATDFCHKSYHIETLSED